MLDRQTTGVTAAVVAIRERKRQVKEIVPKR